MLLSTHLRRKASRRSEEGYILLFLLLLVALMTIFAATLVTSIKFEMKRDREEEMIHRGVQYERAIRAFYRKFNRYPAKIEDLENTSQYRSLRKRYKDPITGKDFKLVHYGEVKMAGSIGGGMIPGANQVGANGTLVSANGQQSSGFGGNSGFGSNSAFGQSSGFGQNSGFGQSSGFGQNSNSTFGQNSNSSTQTQDAPGGQTSTGQNSNGDTSQAGSDASQSGASQPGAGTNSNGPFGGNSSSDKLGSTQFGGAPIIGVASTSKDKTIREFDKKRKYNEWMFVYDPMMDRGGLIKTPYQPNLMMQMMSQGVNLNGQNPGQNGNNTNGSFGNSGNGFGNNNGFGNSSGFGNSFGNSPGGVQNNPNPTGGFGNPNQPPIPPQQQ